jgi:HD-like signal output (HDOD) protein
MREVSAIAFEMSLRAAFPPAAELEPVWERAAKRGLMMGRIGQMIGVDPWACHSAGLFEECGKAVLYRHAPQHYPAMLRAAASDIDLCALENAAFGVSHDALGAALCESWGLAPAAVASVRHHVAVQSSGQMPEALQRRGVASVSAIVHTLMSEPSELETRTHGYAQQAQLDEAACLRAARRVQEQLENQD